jgi:hypothetical protein
LILYLNNLKIWLYGFGKLGTLKYKPGWNRWTMLPLYLIDHGTHVLCGGAVETWSLWAYTNRKKYPVAGFINRLLNHLQDGHGKKSGTVLWGTLPSMRPRYQVLMALVWVVILVVSLGQ